MGLSMAKISSLEKSLTDAQAFQPVHFGAAAKSDGGSSMDLLTPSRSSSGGNIMSLWASLARCCAAPA